MNKRVVVDFEDGKEKSYEIVDFEDATEAELQNELAKAIAISMRELQAGEIIKIRITEN